MAQALTVYAAGPLTLADRGTVYLHMGLSLPPTRVGPPRHFTVSGAREREERPEIQASLLAVAWGRLYALPASAV